MAANLVPVQILAQLLDMSERRVQQLATQGVIPKPEDRQYDLVASVKGYVHYLRKQIQGGGEASLVDERASHERLKKELTALKLQRERGELVPSYQPEEWLETLVTGTKVAFLRLPRRAAPFVVLIQEEKGVEFYLREEIKRSLRDMWDYLNGQQKKKRKPTATTTSNRRVASS
jgi:hypothetical protein